MAKEAFRLKKPKFFTFMVIPHDKAGGVLNFRLRDKLVYTFLGISGAVILFFIFALYFSTSLSGKLAHYNVLLQETQKQSQELDQFSEKTKKLDTELENLSQRDNELRKLLGLKASPSTNLRKRGVTSDRATRENLALLSSELESRKESYQQLLKSVGYIRDRFARTPSSWPVYGRMTSGFGYRTSPWFGFHSGVDISSWYGAPIRATADGVVTYAGWKSGYGLTIQISHGDGIDTLYGHASSLAVADGQRVKKGQVISYIGTTGFSTGPHVHYEVIRSGQAINPVAYLSLDVFSASKLW